MHVISLKTFRTQHFQSYSQSMIHVNTIYMKIAPYTDHGTIYLYFEQFIFPQQTTFQKLG